MLSDFLRNMSKAKIINFRLCHHFRIDGDLVWLKKCGRVKVIRNSYALHTGHVLKIADMIRKVQSEKQSRATGKVE